MKQLLSLVLLILAFFISKGQGLPSVSLRTLDGKAANLSDISNDSKPMIICIWEVSCKPCIQEFDNIAEVYNQWQEKTGVKLIAISVDDNRNYSKVVPLVKSKRWPFEFYQDKNQDTKRALGAPNCPFTAIIDGEGNIVWRKTSYLQGDEQEIISTIQKLIENK